VSGPSAAPAPLGVAIIGCGLIGQRRAAVVRRSIDEKLVIVADVDEGRARAVAGEISCLATGDWREVVARNDVDAVVISTTNNWLAPIAIAALRNGKHVLIEKPMARTPAEAEAILQAAGYGEPGASVSDGRRAAVGGHPLVVKVGFNHRFHAGIHKARELFSQGAIGEILFIRCRYGHGGRPGYEKEWRVDPRIAGGGELLDQGVHAIDLFLWFLGEFTEVCGFTATYAWMPESGAQKAESRGVEDNAFALFRTAAGQVATLHASWTQWKNLFSFEVFGRDGYLVIEGLGGSYGPERLRIGKRTGKGALPVEQLVEYPSEDISWEAEWKEFIGAIREHRQPLANGYDGWRAIRMVHAVYEAARTQQVVRL